MGTFLVRSGVLTSVHAFAVDPRRGVFILAIMALLIGGALALYAWRAPRLQQGGLFAPISREGALVLNNVLLTTACATVFIGTLYPLALEVAHRRQDLGRPALLQSDLRPADAAAAAGDAVRAAASPGSAAISPALRSGCSRPPLALLAARRRRSPLYWRGPWLAPFGIALGVWVIAGALSEWAARVKLFARRCATRLCAAPARLPRSAYGSTLAHAGIGLSVIGIVATTAWQSEQRGRHAARRARRDRRLRARPSAASPRRRAPTTASRSASSP